jgi:hypothetical protein
VCGGFDGAGELSCRGGPEGEGEWRGRGGEGC